MTYWWGNTNTMGQYQYYGFTVQKLSGPVHRISLCPLYFNATQDRSSTTNVACVPDRNPSSDVNPLQVLLIGITVFHGIRGAVSWLNQDCSFADVNLGGARRRRTGLEEVDLDL